MHPLSDLPPDVTLAVTQSETASDVIDFGLGHPGADLLPLGLMAHAAAARLQGEDSSLLQYGHEQGDGYFRRALAAFLTRHYGQPIDMDGLFVTGGASQALDLICTLYTQPGDVVFVEEPTYFLALRIFADHHLRAIPIATDNQGMRPEAVDAALAHHRPALLYSIPTFQNPSGVTLSLARRQQLAELAEDYNFLIVADEVYHLLSYAAPPPPPLASYAATGHVLGLGSFSKILAPGLRLGWVQAAPQHIDRMVNSGLLDSGGGLNPFTSGIVRMALDEGWQDAHLAHVRQVYGRRANALTAALRLELSDQVAFAAPAGGYFHWLTLPAHLDGEALFRRAPRYKVGFRPGARFSATGQLQHCLRLSFAHYDEGQLAEGVSRLRLLLTEFQPTR
jgi:DNA-binding transcriptional MocR family regulator